MTPTQATLTCNEKSGEYPAASGELLAGWWAAGMGVALGQVVKLTRPHRSLFLRFL